MRTFNLEDWPNLANRMRHPFQRDYLAMYSSVYGGIVTDPVLMLIPIDDHLVHRGDGVFESMKCENGGIYNMHAHLERLEHSALGLGHRFPCSLDDIGMRIVETVRAAGERNCAIRVLLSRGPGSFNVNPYDCPEPQLYIVVTRLGPAFMDQHPEGARLLTSRIPLKDAFFAELKHCNYLANVLMKKEAVDAGVDFVAAFDARGHLAEGATENLGIVNCDAELLFPQCEGILRGTTMVRLMELAGELVTSGDLKGVDLRDISRTDILNAREVIVVGTTRDVTLVREFDGQTVGRGGPIYARLRQLLRDDILNNEKMLTRVF
jgi:branched-subunit amino acid aminotransferase/4-amino-4-deoxychorismate lyase